MPGAFTGKQALRVGGGWLPGQRARPAAAFGRSRCPSLKDGGCSRREGAAAKCASAAVAVQACGGQASSCVGGAGKPLSWGWRLQACRNVESGGKLGKKEKKLMETDLEQPVVCVAAQPHCQEMQCSPSEVFPPPLRIPEKIPPIKPCFKKKQQAQKRLDTEALRALRPIFTSLLGAGTLDGIFVPRGQNGSHGSLCEPVAQKPAGAAAPCPQPDNSVAVLLPGAPDAQGQIADGPPEQGGQIGEQVFPSVTSPAAEAFHAVSGDAAAFRPCPEKALEGYLPGGVQDHNLSLALCDSKPAEKFGAGLFQDKSEEASLDLVFEILNQLQYHTHQKDGVDICVDFLQGGCVLGSDCPQHHTVLPYHWQVRRTPSQAWQSVTNDSQEHLERLYCNPDNDRVKVRYR
ncbi:UNVERIFIED_CONTAM: hypothetical protein K2H54_057862 [Gekko kuhli]